MKSQSKADTSFKGSWADTEARRPKTGHHPLAPKSPWVVLKTSHWRFMGCTIEKTFPSGMFAALVQGHGTVRADTLAGCCDLIREKLKDCRQTLRT